MKAESGIELFGSEESISGEGFKSKMSEGREKFQFRISFECLTVKEGLVKTNFSTIIKRSATIKIQNFHLKLLQSILIQCSSSHCVTTVDMTRQKFSKLKSFSFSI